MAEAFSPPEIPLGHPRSFLKTTPTHTHRCLSVYSSLPETSPESVSAFTTASSTCPLRVQQAPQTTTETELTLTIHLVTHNRNPGVIQNH